MSLLVDTLILPVSVHEYPESVSLTVSVLIIFCELPRSVLVILIPSLVVSASKSIPVPLANVTVSLLLSATILPVAAQVNPPVLSVTAIVLKIFCKLPRSAFPILIAPFVVSTSKSIPVSCTIVSKSVFPLTLYVPVSANVNPLLLSTTSILLIISCELPLSVFSKVNPPFVVSMSISIPVKGISVIVSVFEFALKVPVSLILNPVVVFCTTMLPIIS